MNANRKRTLTLSENTEHEHEFFSKVSNTNEHEHIFTVKYWTRTNTNTHFFENVEHERTRTRVPFKLLNTANTNEHEHSCIFIPGADGEKVSLVSLNFSHENPILSRDMGPKNFFIAIFEKNRSKYIGLNRLNIRKLTMENQAFCTCPSLWLIIDQNLNIGRLRPPFMTHNLWVKNHVSLNFITSAAFDLGDIGRFDSTSAALTSATFDQTSAALARHRSLSTVPMFFIELRKLSPNPLLMYSASVYEPFVRILG